MIGTTGGVFTAIIIFITFLRENIVDENHMQKNLWIF